MENYQNYASVVGIIKEFLHNFNLPMVPVYTEDTIPYKDRVYIKDNKIVRYNGTEFDSLSIYNYNREVLNLTNNLNINSSTYDNHTHTYLGEYLRFLRDYNKLDLMSMYNCFNNEQPSKIYHVTALEKDDTGSVTKSHIINTSDNGYNFYVVPVKFNKLYTIAIDSSCSYEIECILYDNKFISSISDELIKQSLKKISGSMFSNPYLYSTYFDCVKDCWQKEKILMMLIKLPKMITSSITILEGNYTECSNVVDGTLFTNFIYNEEKLPTVYYSKNSLLEYNSHISYPFSDKLVEYIIGNTIDSREYIPNNVERIQTQLFPDGIKGYNDIWDEENIRKTIHEYTLKEDITKGRNSRWGNEIDVCSAERSSEGEPSVVSKHKFVKKFIDVYNDVTSYVDKDIETMVELSYSTKTKILFNETDLYVYAVYGWMLNDIDIPVKEGYIFNGYWSSDDEGTTLKKQYYNSLGGGMKRWDILEEKVTLYPSWIEEV